MRLVDPRPGEEVQVRRRTVPFSMWPTGRGQTREKLQSIIFATDPWNLIRSRLAQLANDSAKLQSQALLSQAREFFHASEYAYESAAKPLLLYYSFLNLAKCLVVFRSGAPLQKLNHGISERLPTTRGAVHGEVEFEPNNASGAFQNFAQALNASLPQSTGGANNKVKLRSADFLAQILVGHRMFCDGEGITERFVSVDKIMYLMDSNTKSLWMTASFRDEDLTRFGYSKSSVANALGRNSLNGWRMVKAPPDLNQLGTAKFEQRGLFGFVHRPSDSLNLLSRSLQNDLWRNVLSYPPYRKYYVYIPTASQIVIHQLLSIYLGMFYFGSITRYKPEEFSFILNSKIGPFVHEFFVNQPNQFLYLMASEFAQQDVSRAAIA